MLGEAMRIKYLFITGLQLLMVCILWFVVVIERLLTTALERLSLYILCPRAFKVLQWIVESRPEDGGRQPAAADNTTDADKAIKDILFLLDKRNNNLLNIDRKTFEETAVGREMRAKHPDRHLYAVLQPIRAENLKRIENVLRAMAPDALQRVHRNASKSMKLFV